MRMLETATKELLRTHVNILAAPFSHLHLFSDGTWDALIHFVCLAFKQQEQE